MAGKKVKKKVKAKDRMRAELLARERGAENRTEVPARFTGGRKGSPAQVKWVLNMLDSKNLDASPEFAERTRGLSPEDRERFIEEFKTRVPDLSFDTIGKLIERLKYLPRKGVQPRTAASNGYADSLKRLGLSLEFEEMADDKGKVTRRGRIITKKGRVLSGSYGLKTPGDEFKNNITFFRVWVGDRGGWDVQMYVSDDLRRVELSEERKLWVLNKIAKNPAKAAARFGHEFKRCGICNRGLTNDLSRELGIGPVCRERL